MLRFAQHDLSKQISNLINLRELQYNDKVTAVLLLFFRQRLELQEAICEAIVTLKEAGGVSGMAGRASGDHAQQEGVLVAIDSHVNDMLGVAGGASFMPQFTPTA